MAVVNLQTSLGPQGAKKGEARVDAILCGRFLDMKELFNSFEVILFWKIIELSFYAQKGRSMRNQIKKLQPNKKGPFLKHD